MNMLQDEARVPTRNFSTINERILLHKKLEEKINRFNAQSLRKENLKLKQNNTTTIEDLPPDPLIKRSLIPRKKPKFVNRAGYM